MNIEIDIAEWFVMKIANIDLFPPGVKLALHYKS